MARTYVLKYVVIRKENIVWRESLLGDMMYYSILVFLLFSMQSQLLQLLEQT